MRLMVREVLGIHPDTFSCIANRPRRDQVVWTLLAIGPRFRLTSPLTLQWFTQAPVGALALDVPSAHTQRALGPSVRRLFSVLHG